MKVGDEVHVEGVLVNCDSGLPFFWVRFGETVLQIPREWITLKPEISIVPEAVSVTIGNGDPNER